MADYTLRKSADTTPRPGRRLTGRTITVDLEGHRSVLDGILQAKDREDGSIGIRCSCQAAICGSCGVRVNGQAKLACNTKLERRGRERADDGAIVVEPMGNMPVLKDLIVNMDAVHWKKVQRVVPWLLPAGDPPEREYVVPPESMIDVTQSMACIHCGACVSDCLSLEVDPLFIGPAALAKAYRFVGDPRDAQDEERLRDLAEDPHGIYDCTHCFSCVEVCPKGVAPMDQIMRLRRRATHDFEINDQNNGAPPRAGVHEASSARRARSTSASCSRTASGRSARRAAIELIRGAADRSARLRARQDHAEDGALPREAAGRRERAAHLRPRRGAPRGAEPLHRRRGRRRAGAGPGGAARMKVAYWPGCVSRGFTPELHGSMALVADRLGIELVELDRANCCGAGVIAEHNPELADTLNARTFAMAQKTGLAMMNICSTCQGAQSECQERLDADTGYRAPHQRGAGAPRASTTRAASRTRTSSGCWSRTTGSTRLKRAT